MATAAMFWGGAAYNNGILPFKHYILGEAYTRDGEPASSIDAGEADAGDDARARHRCRSSIRCRPGRSMPPADIFRVFERGGRIIGTQFPEIGLPELDRRDRRRSRSPAGPTSASRTADPAPGCASSIPVLNITKTRLNDPVHLVPRHQRPARRLPQFGLRRAATSSMPTTATSRDSRALRAISATRRHERQRRSDHPQGRDRPSAAARDSRARSRPASA